jgi:2-polyprenyl-3-methyl-5-hydroxy-6-metoxy-1,4-benzoquinol methylase
MLARRNLPDQYAQWNRTWGAPYGRSLPLPVTSYKKLQRYSLVQRLRGPFAFQGNSTTRAYEYPWTYHQLHNLGPSRIVEIGGAFSGLQFVLAKDGHEVHNVDPFFDYGRGGYEVEAAEEHASLNRAFGTNVILHKSTLPEADLTGRFSAKVCVSTLEHLPPESIEATLSTVKRLIAPGGLVVLTIDLFLNLAPFCDRTTNIWGSNSSVAWIEDILGYEMIAGERTELYGYKEFSADNVLGRLEEFAVNAGYPQMAQLVTFRAS